MSIVDALASFLYAVIAYNIALLYGTVGEILNEKSGSLNLGVEGIMAMGGMGGYLIGCATDSMFMGLLGAFLVGGIFGLIFSFLTVTLQANQNVIGLTITTFGIALYFFIGRGLGDKFPAFADSPSFKAAFQPVAMGFLSDIPIIGKALFSQSPLVYLAIAIAIIAGVYLKRTKAGLRTRAVGENPAAADSAGINITAVKYTNIICGTGIMGIGGLYLGLYMGGSFEGSATWTNGMGWIAIALVIFANWKPIAAILGTFVFGLFFTLDTQKLVLVDAMPFLSFLTKIPTQLYSALPFIITAIVLIVTSISKRKNNNEPTAIGLNYFREER